MNHSHAEVLKYSSASEKHDKSLPTAKSSLRAVKKKFNKNIKNYHTLNDFDKQINQTLSSFWKERDRQHGVIKTMRELLTERSCRPILRLTNAQLSALNKDETKVEKYKSKAKLLKLRVAQEKSESCKLLRLVNNYEREVSTLRKSNHELKEALQEFGDVKAGCIIAREKLQAKKFTSRLIQENHLGEYKSRIKQILKDGGCKNAQHTNAESVDCLFDELHHLVIGLAKDKKSLQAKYTKLLTAYKDLMNEKENQKSAEKAKEEKHEVKQELAKRAFNELLCSS
eukprot:TRINITY_DN5010_c0_g1_i1.p1 TRINITY_DN5010_c0_g1~~TRINITY_DN5010_c0_g1_i1.p1  ORF type:complete len:284 (+),score=73.14 TRINITY_DN5010_c0_g1_i1:221-1072(+)